MYSLTKSLHNIIGMVVLLILLVVFILVFIKLLKKKVFNKSSKTAALIGLITIHTQFLLGWLLYFLSPMGMSNFSGAAMKTTVSRFYIIEHPVGMVLAAVLITIGYRKIKKDRYTDTQKHRQILIYYGLGLVLTGYFIPWFIWS